jgi:hypothetical protein
MLQDSSPIHRWLLGWTLKETQSEHRNPVSPRGGESKMTEEISEQEAGQRKQRALSEAVAAGPHWRFDGVWASAQQAEDHINTAPAQGPGEVSATYNFADGRVALFLYY